MKTLRIIEQLESGTKEVAKCQLTDDGAFVSMDGDLDFLQTLEQGTKDQEGRTLTPQNDGIDFFKELKKQYITSSRFSIEGIDDENTK